MSSFVLESLILCSFLPTKSSYYVAKTTDCFSGISFVLLDFDIYEEKVDILRKRLALVS